MHKAILHMCNKSYHLKSHKTIVDYEIGIDQGTTVQLWGYVNVLINKEEYICNKNANVEIYHK